nr:MAG TPA: hypothetical protein [Caudoviricetes sp.]
MISAQKCDIIFIEMKIKQCNLSKALEREVILRNNGIF